MYRCEVFKLTKVFFGLLTFIALVPHVLADGGPAWAYPVADKVQPPAPDGESERRVPNSTLTYKAKDIDNLFEPPIWFPERAVGMPRVVRHGAPPAVRACASCHLASGQGHPESGHLSGLPANYFKQQIADYRSGNRTDLVWMTKMAIAMTDVDVQEAADWFAHLKPIKWVSVVEAETIPKSYFNKSRKRLALPEGTEPLGERIAEFPQDAERVLARDPNAGFVAYVPKGSIAKGEALVRQGGAGKSLACAACHGATLQGAGDIPRIAGVSPLYTVRQLYAFKTHARKGVQASQMQAAVANLDGNDIIAIASYLATLAP